MVARQMFGGILGGSSLAMLALFLAVPRPIIEERSPPWLLSLLPAFLIPVEQLEAENQREEAVASSARLAPENEIIKDKGLPEPGERLASLGASTGLVEKVLVDPIEQKVDELPVASPDELDPNLYLGALAKQTIIRLRPDPDSVVIGFARTGALLRRAPVESSRKGCPGGWYRVEPDGYVCVGKAATLDTEHPVIRLASVQPDRSLPLPYSYGKSRYPTPPLYTRIPTREQQEIAEPELRGHLSRKFGSVWGDLAVGPAPTALEEGQMIPRPYGYPHLDQEFMVGRAVASSAFAFTDLFESGGRRWGLTTDLSLLPLDRLTPIELSDFSGVVLRDAEDFPIVFVRSRVQRLYEGSPADGSLRPTRLIQFREAFHLTGEEIKFNGTRFLEIREGGFLKEHSSHLRIDARETLPKWAKNSRSWLEVSLLNQTLVAYRGATPVFATLVSTGRDGVGDPATTHSTIQGIFLIHTKHVTSTMSGDEADDEFDLRDVPYVQYFHEGFAFHAAFWHDGFGQPRSHGCVNLSPLDARRLFNLTEPPVPLPWHSALDTEGSLVYIHP